MTPEKVKANIQRIRENDPTMTEVDFTKLDGNRAYTFETGSDLYKDMVEALEANHTITKVNVIYRFLSKLSLPENVRLFRAIGSLPKLHYVRFGVSGLAGLPLQLINETLDMCSNLRSLTMKSIHFKENVFFKTTSSVNTNDKEFVTFLGRLLDLQNSLETLTLDDVEDTFDLDAVVETVVKLSNLKDLSLRSFSRYNQRLSRSSVEQIFQSKTIRSLKLRRLGLALVLPDPLISLEDNTVLQNLSLDQNEMSLDCGMAVAYLLGTNQTLTSLSLGYNLLPDASGSAIAGSLPNNTTLKSLDITCNDLGLYTCRRFAHLLVANESALEYLNLSQNKLEDDGVAMIASAMERNTKLQSLSLAETKITEGSCAVLAAALQSNATLERLNLSGNRIRKEGCQVLARALRYNTTLTGLNLSGNGIHHEGTLQLAEALTNNRDSRLERLNLDKNPAMTPEAIDAVEGMIQTNYSIKHLWLPAMTQNDSLIRSYVLLNKLGRKQLMQEMDNAELWVEAIRSSVKSSELDIHCLYFLIRSNPTIVSWLPQRSVSKN